MGASSSNHNPRGFLLGSLLTHQTPGLHYLKEQTGMPWLLGHTQMLPRAAWKGNLAVLWLRRLTGQVRMDFKPWSCAPLLTGVLPRACSWIVGNSLMLRSHPHLLTPLKRCTNVLEMAGLRSLMSSCPAFHATATGQEKPSVKWSTDSFILGFYATPQSIAV